MKIEIPEGLAIEIARHFVKSYRQIVAQTWPDPALTPELKKLTVTIYLP